MSAAGSRTGVTLVAPCDEASAALVGTVASVLPAAAPGVPAILRADSRDDLDVLAVARACAPLFVPQPGGIEAAPTLARMLRDGAHEALTSSASAPLPRDGDPEGIAEALAEAARERQRARGVCLISREDDGPYTVATVRQLLVHARRLLRDRPGNVGRRAGGSEPGCGVHLVSALDVPLSLRLPKKTAKSPQQCGRRHGRRPADGRPAPLLPLGQAHPAVVAARRART